MTEYLTAVNALKSMLTERRNLAECLAGASPLAKQISYGVTRNYFSLSIILNKMLEKPIAKKHEDLKLLLLCGLYSIEDLNRPDYASVDFAVETATSLKKPWAKALINSVLRRYKRSQEAIKAQLSDLGEKAQLNHPAWLVSLINEAWGRKEIFEANQARPPMTLRINLRRTSRNNYLQLLKDTNISYRAGSLSETAVILERPTRVDNIPGFKTGLVSVQDEGAQLAAILLNTKPGDMVLDACAAPGGKTGHLLEQADVKVTAVDWSQKRVDKVTDNLQRLGLDADIICTDIEKWQSAIKYHRILLDAPCSATGVIRRHPEIKLLRTKSDIDKLTSAQTLLLNKVFSLLINGGELLYSTCSILPSENDDVIGRFLSSRSDAEKLELELDRRGENIVTTEHGIQLLPTIKDHDGFYYAKLRKVR